MRTLLLSLVLVGCVGLVVGAEETKTAGKKAMIEKQAWGKTKDGKDVELYTCTNKNGLVLKVATYGATIVSVKTPDRTGKKANITLSFPKLEGYLERHPYFGSTVGRYGNRIAKGKFSLEGKEYTLATNNGPNHLHGGKVGFDALVWKAEEVKSEGSVGVKFSLTSPDGDEGFPGAPKTTVTYSLTDADELKMDYTATTDKATVINLTNHNYWNLGGAGSGDILKHELTLAADEYLPIDATAIPLGKPAAVKGTAMDFSTPHAIGERIGELKKPPHETKGYDHCYVLRGQKGKLELAATVKDAKVGAGDGNSDDRTRDSTLLRQFPRRHPRQRRFQAARCVLFGNATLS